MCSLQIKMKHFGRLNTYCPVKQPSKKYGPMTWLPTMPHQQLTFHGYWNGTLLIYRGFPFAQYSILYLFTFPVFTKLASSEKTTWLKNETSVRIFLRIHLQKLTCFRKSLPRKSWCNDIRYGWNLYWCKILNTDRWLIRLFFSICLLLT